MKIKVLGKNVGVIILTNLLMGCANQLTPQGGAHAEPNSAQLKENNPQVVSSAALFVSLQQQYMYKVLVAEIAARRGYYEVAATYFFDVAQQTRNSYLVERATLVALHARQYEIATAAARLWVEIAPDNLNARQILVKMLLRQKNTAEILVHLEAMLDSAKDNPQQQQEVMALLEQQDPEEALKWLEQLVTKRPKDSTTLLIYGRLLINAEQWDKAQAILQQLIQQVPNHPQAVPLYAYLLDKQGQSEQALQWMRQALYQYPDQQEWRLMYARLLAEAEKFDESIRQFEQLLSQHPQQGDILYALGVLSLQKEQLAAAKKYFTELLKIGEQDNIAYYYLGQIAQVENDLTTALSWYKKVDGGPIYLNAQARIALILSEQGHLDQAIEYLQNVPVEDDDEAITLIQLEAELLIDKEQYDRAMAAYNRALQLKPDNIDLRYSRALLAEKMGLLEQLEQDLHQVLLIDPNNINALNALGYSLTAHTTRYQEAYELIKRALQLSSDNEEYYILDSMGWVLYKMGKYAEAIAYLRKAQAKQNDPEVAAHLGEVLWESGDQTAAQIVWKEALQNFPNDEKLQAVIRHFLP
ncbi:MAG: tetratricopeptide repeat protein [Thioploca sp.]|nr:tetratricopeptide repeat protein [Thioploca sp.]